MSFKAKDRQRIIDAYLAETGRNMFVAPEFVDWLADQPDHEMYDAFYGMSDTEAARQHRIGLARRMASGLWIVARQETVEARHGAAGRGEAGRSGHGVVRSGVAWHGLER